MMTASATTTRTQSKTTEKAAATRLLDLLAGWSNYVSADEENETVDSALSAEEIGVLYQRAGELSESWEHLTEEDQERAVRTFVEEQVVPALLRGRVSQE